MQRIQCQKRLHQVLPLPGPPDKQPAAKPEHKEDNLLSVKGSKPGVFYEADAASGRHMQEKKSEQ